MLLPQIGVQLILFTILNEQRKDFYHFFNTSKTIQCIFKLGHSAKKKNIEFGLKFDEMKGCAKHVMYIFNK